MNIIWSPLALDRVSEIAGYIAQDKPSAAEKWIKTIFSKVEQLEISPELGLFQKLETVNSENLSIVITE